MKAAARSPVRSTLSAPNHPRPASQRRTKRPLFKPFRPLSSFSEDRAPTDWRRPRRKFWSITTIPCTTDGRPTANVAACSGDTSIAHLCTRRRLRNLQCPHCFQHFQTFVLGPQVVVSTYVPPPLQNACIGQMNDHTCTGQSQGTISRSLVAQTKGSYPLFFGLKSSTMPRPSWRRFQPSILEKGSRRGVRTAGQMMIHRGCTLLSCTTRGKHAFIFLFSIHLPCLCSLCSFWPLY